MDFFCVVKELNNENRW
ncbi:hypothetical protein Gotri_027179 [Gossypium trilobum]|uniref:Uncharacterized protein n=1 Tax=Gossypium trilobum TaxID=34281 RepID=A0A7J9FKY7_9ROSI|nr:hypothetical protein [Gossypium trilobum]